LFITKGCLKKGSLFFRSAVGNFIIFNPVNLKTIMMRKNLLLLLALFVLTLPLHAQVSGGVKGGLAMATMNADVPSGVDNPFKLGFYGGGFIVIGGGVLRFQPELLYTQKGVRFESKSSAEYWRATYSYLELPLMARLQFGINKVNVYLNVGGYGAYWLSGKTTTYTLNLQGQLEENSEDYEFDEEFDNRLDGGLVFGAGVKILFFFVEGRYSMGLVNSKKEGTDKDKTKMSYIGVALGVQF